MKYQILVCITLKIHRITVSPTFQNFIIFYLLIQKPFQFICHQFSFVWPGILELFEKCSITNRSISISGFLLVIHGIIRLLQVKNIFCEGLELQTLSKTIYIVSSNIPYDEYTCIICTNLYLQLNGQKIKSQPQLGKMMITENQIKSKKNTLSGQNCTLNSIQFLYFVFQLALYPSMQNQQGKIDTLISKPQQGLIFSFFVNLIHIVFPSERSQTAFKIKTVKNSIDQNSLTHKHYLSQKRFELSHILKREYSTNEETKKYQKSLTKKININESLRRQSQLVHQIDLKNILKVLDQKQDDYFSLHAELNPSKNNGYQIKSVEDKKICFPDSALKQISYSKNELLKRAIQIMSNKNQKISIPIHEGLYKSNTSHKNQYVDEKWNQIPNLCDFKTKNQYSQSIQFIRQYKSGYAPIQMQKRNHQQVQDDKQKQLRQESPIKNGTKDKTRSHFIRKQQSTLTLPRTCGVSYIKPSQSNLTQKAPFQPLPPLIFQGSTTCAIGSNQNYSIQKDIDYNHKQLINSFISSLQKSWIAFIMSNDDQMRDLLLGKKTKHAKVGFVNGIQNLWPLFTEGSFILIFITSKSLSTQKQVWKVFLNKQSYFRIGILAKKSTSGRKAFLKSIKGEVNDNFSLAGQDTKLNQFNLQLNCNKLSSQANSAGNNQQNNAKVSLQIENKLCNTFQLLEQQLKDCRTVMTMSLRLEMYVQQTDWKDKFTRQNKAMLNQIIMNLKDRLQKRSIRVIQQRFQLEKDGKNNYYNKNFNFLRIPNSMEQQMTEQTKSYQNQQNQLAINNFLQQQKKTNELHCINKNILFNYSRPCSPADFLKNTTTDQSWKKSLKFPLYYISTRDSFAFDLIQKSTSFKRSNGRQYTKIDYYFYPDNIPTNFGSQYRKLFPQFDVGVTAYHGFFTQQQLKQFQQKTFQLEQKAFKNQFLQMTVQPSIVSTKIKRTKFFFGYRYMWTRCQLSEPCSYVGAGVRKDVNSAPSWTKTIQNQMVKENLVEKDFLNSIAINVYHDGKEGLAQHFDDAVRFKQPIYTLRLFSDARLSFGSQFYGFCNGAFIIPLPRGCILVMQQNSYAANGVKHCVRPCDMTGKSAAVILRQMHSQVVNEASKYDQFIDFPAWLSCLSDNQEAISYAQQKRLESQHIMKVKID